MQSRRPTRRYVLALFKHILDLRCVRRKGKNKAILKTIAEGIGHYRDVGLWRIADGRNGDLVFLHASEVTYSANKTTRAELIDC